MEQLTPRPPLLRREGELEADAASLPNAESSGSTVFDVAETMFFSPSLSKRGGRGVSSSKSINLTRSCCLRPWASSNSTATPSRIRLSSSRFAASADMALRRSLTRSTTESTTASGTCGFRRRQAAFRRSARITSRLSQRLEPSCTSSGFAVKQLSSSKPCSSCSFRRIACSMSSSEM